jgi:phosphatidylserine/phosphatidylglycerophosphate/cardiolipin synthase-like enzyme
MAPLAQSGTYHVKLEAADHVTLEADLTFDGSDADKAVALVANAANAKQGLSLSHDRRAVSGKDAWVHTLYAGLRHKWFSAQGRPARRGNTLALLMDGEEAWSRVRQDLTAASKSVLVSTWWWESNFELVRDPATHIGLSQADRWKNTILGTLEKSTAHRRILVGQFWGQDSILGWMTTDSKLKAYADAPNDGFEFMGMANPTEGKFLFEPSTFQFGDRVRAELAQTAGRAFAAEQPIGSNVPPHPVDLTQWPVQVEVQHASYHQKFLVVDHEVAYVGGMNLRRVDWDSSQHTVYDYRRMLFDATVQERTDVKDKKAEPDMGPRKDYMVRIEGPAAQDAADVFQKRWAYQLAQKVDYADKSTPFDVVRSIPTRPGGKQAQVTATLPKPFWEHAIAETWFNAVEQAQHYIFIEDQYFRVPMLNDAIVARMKQIPGLRLVVITKPVNEWTDPGCAWTYKSHAAFESQFPDRYRLYQLRAFDTVVTWGIDETESRFQDMDVHSKMLIVDDRFMSVGSCNKNNRGLVYEGEMNVAVADAAWVTAARRRILANLLAPGTTPTDDAATWFQQMKSAAALNDAVYAKWDAEGFDISLDGKPLPSEYQPRGFLYSMDFPDVTECLMESVGPDMVGRPD